MLDLDAIFNPDRAAVEPRNEAVSLAGAELRVEDLEPDWRIAWEERSAVLEYDGCHPRERAEAIALSEIVAMRRTGI